MRKKNVTNRRKVALKNLQNAKFFEKGKRTEAKWTDRVQSEIATLEQRLKHQS